jgi:hypothetical protein
MKVLKKSENALFLFRLLNHILHQISSIMNTFLQTRSPRSFPIVKSLLAFTLLIVGFLPSIAQPEIIGGEPIEIYKVPWQVSLEVNGTHDCGGSILNAEWVLTAGHCIVSESPSAYVVHAGATNQTNNSVGQRIQVVEIIKHPFYTDNPRPDYDLALLRLAQPLCFNENVQPIQYATPQNTSESEISPSSVVLISGWGLDSTLRAAELPVITNANANNLLNNPDNNCYFVNGPVNLNMLAFYANNGVAAEPGDSGGPAVIMPGGGSAPKLVGASSWGGCPRSVFPTVYANVRYLSDFISSNIAAVTTSSCGCSTGDIIIESTTHYDADVEVANDIIVKSGAQLTISATLGMASGRKIVVERNARLVVALGGKIMRCGTSPWEGILVQGNSTREQPMHTAPLTDPEQAGIVWVNGGKIEWAEKGISTIDLPAKFRGGLVRAENAIFENNQKAIEIGRYTGFQNKSLMDKSIFREVGDAFPDTEGIIVRETDGVQIQACTLSNLDYEGVRAYDAAVKIINGNQIGDNETGVSAFASAPMMGQLIVGDATALPNVFSNNQYHINASLTTGFYGQLSNGRFALQVLNNDFQNGDYGVIVEGPSDYTVAGNTFAGTGISGWAANTGYNNIFNESLIGCNAIGQGDNMGILAIGENDHLQFLANDFGLNASGTDFLLINSYYPSVNGSVRDQQGEPQRPTENCFTNPSVQTDILTWGNTDPFTYYYQGGLPPVNCYPEPLELGNYSKSEVATLFSPFNCAQFGGLPNELPNPTINDLNIKRNKIQQITPYIATSPAAKAKYYRLLAEKDAILRYLLQQAIANKNFGTAESLLTGEQSKAADWAIFGLRLVRKNYPAAHAWLLQMPVQNPEDAAFHDVQSINLLRLQQADTEGAAPFVLTPAQEALLSGIAEGTSPVRGYARGVLASLLGRRFYPEEVDILAERSMQYGSKLPTGEMLKVSPVPAASMLAVHWALGSGDSDIMLSVFDMRGCLLLQESVVASVGALDIEVRHLPVGTYFLTVSDKGKFMGKKTFFIQR